MFKDLCSKAKDLPSAAVRDHHQLSKARVIDSEEVRPWGEMERKDSKEEKKHQVKWKET